MQRCTEHRDAFPDLSLNVNKLFARLYCNCSGFFKGRSLSMQQQMMQQSRQLDPNLLMKQQTPPSQQQSLHQPSMKSFLENVIPHATPELQKGPSPINAFSSFPIGGFLHTNFIQLNAYRTPSLPFHLPGKTTGTVILLALTVLMEVVIHLGLIQLSLFTKELMSQVHTFPEVTVFQCRCCTFLKHVRLLFFLFHPLGPEDDTKSFCS